jgi:hypothetical protein
MESAYVEHMCTPGGPIFSSVNDAVLKQPMIVDSSRYWEVYDAYRTCFGESNIKIVWFEEYVVDPMKVLRDVCLFLDIDASSPIDFTKQRTNGREFSEQRLADLGRNNIRIDCGWNPKVRRDVIDLIRNDNVVAP